MFNTFLTFLFRIDERGTEDTGIKDRIEVVDRVNNESSDRESSDRAQRARALLSGRFNHKQASKLAHVVCQ